jgi:hypothetical protein
MGYAPDERGLTQYAKHLAKCMEETDPTLAQIIVMIRRETWRMTVATAFGLKPDDIPEMTIPEARNFMHKVTSKMQSPDVLKEIEEACSTISSK